MADKTLEPSEKAFLMLLMAEAREVSNTEMKQRYGVSLTGKDRTSLTDQKLVTGRTIGRGLAHELTDLGWARCREELASDYVVAKNVGAVSPALHAVLAAVHRHLVKNDLSLADFFAPTDAPPLPEKATPAKKAAKAPTKRLLPKTVVDKIRKAYRELQSEPRAWVSLTDLRMAISNVMRDQLDEVLEDQARNRKIRLIPEENQKTLTDADRTAAVRVGGEDMHLISIELR